MEEVSLGEALKKIRCEGAAERNNGLAGAVARLFDDKTCLTGTDLTHILSQNRDSSKLDALSDKAYHQIFEALFRLSTSQSSSYARSSKGRARSQAASRLSACADVLLKTVKVGVRKLRYKTVKALVEHVTQTLPTIDDGYCEPLVPDYFKALRVILEYPPHPEHFKKDDWHEVADFCNEAIHDLNYVLNENESSLSHRIRESSSFRDTVSRSATPQAHGNSLRKTSNNDTQISGKLSLKSSAEDLILCTRYLHVTPNAPIGERPQAVLKNLIDFLRLSSHASHTQQAAFECINSILARIVTDDTRLAQDTVKSVLPLISRYWQPKSSTLKDSMLISLLYGEPHFKQIVRSDEKEGFTSDLQDLLEAFKDDYCKRPEREQLQFADLNLANAPYDREHENPLCLKAFKARPGVIKVEQPWALLQVSRSIISALDLYSNAQNQTHAAEEFNPAMKRRKISSSWENVLLCAKMSQGAERLHAVQIMAFLLDQPVDDEHTMQYSLDVLLSCLSENNGTIVSWAMLAMSSASYSPSAKAASLHDLWLQAFKITMRYITSTLICRAACHLLSSLLETALIEYLEITDVVDNMISSFDLSGPAVCVDSSNKLLSVIAPLRCKFNIGSITETLERILRWLFTRWSPRMLHDRTHTAQIAQLCPARSVVQLLSICLGLPLQEPRIEAAQRLGRISQADVISLRKRNLTHYLLLELNHAADFDLAKSFMRTSSQIDSSSLQQKKIFGLISEYLATETSVTFHDVFQPGSSTGPLTITPDMAKVALSLSIVDQAILSYDCGGESRRKEDLRILVGALMKKLIGKIVESGVRGDFEDGLYEVMLDFPAVDVVRCSGQDLLSSGVAAVAQYFDTDYWRTRNSNLTQNNIKCQDVMDIEDDFESQGSHQQGSDETLTADISHEEIGAATGYMAFRACQAAKLCFISHPLLELNDETTTESAMTISEPLLSPNFVEYLTQLQPQDFLSCRKTLQEILESGYRLGEKEAGALLEYIGQELVGAYEFERCEVALGVCLDVLTALADLWTTADMGEVTDLGSQLYEWFIRKALEGGIASPHVQISISTMLQRVIKVHPEYAKGLSLESARTSLFRVLQEGSLVVKYHVGNSISEIFGLFILKEHENILQDIVSRLPASTDYLEGIALRLYIFSRLGAAWSTLLRRCVYHILETPGPIPESRGHAKHCVTYLTMCLGLEDSQELFRLFASQIIYTWLETQALMSLPYDIFSYASIKELLRDVQSDAVGQIIMRGRDDEAIQLARNLETSYNQLLEDSFSKVAAYSMARDLSIAQSHTSQAPGAEARLRKCLGKEQYFSLVTAHFPYILATFFRTIDEEEHIQKGLSKHLALQNVLVAHQEMTTTSSSARVVPINQQPSFRAKFLIPQIDQLCRRSVFESDSMWSPVLFVYVFRDLMSGIHPALGSSHACAIIRRIRILISMAGSIALEGYPLEMALHSLRPFLTDAQCSEDSIGIFQYLLSHSESYLQEVPSFLVGIAVSTLTSTKAFLGCAQESTTQESEYKATMSKANAFHAWFTAFLSRYTSSQLTGATEQSFKSIIAAARNVRDRGNAKKGSYESDLLLELLEDQRSGRNLLDQASRNLVLNLLCSAFESPPNVRDDILGEDQLAARYAGVIWNTCQRSNCGRNYLVWAGRVLGRAFAGTGSVDRAMVSEMQLENILSDTAASSSEPSSASRTSILKSLCSILLVENYMEVGAAEKTLRSIMNKAHSTEYFSDCEQVLPSSLMASMLWDQHHPVPELFKLSLVKPLSECAKLDEDVSVSSWVRQLCIALALTGDEDPILSELPQILSVVGGLAKQIFPYVLHLVLLNEAGGQEKTKRVISEATHEWLKNSKRTVMPHVKILLEAVLYLRKQPLPNEMAKADRSRWLEIDYSAAASAAVTCSMFKTALFFLETSHSEAAKASRRSSGVKFDEPADLLLEIYQNVDEQDSFYGVQQPSSLASLTTRLEYEQAGFKSLSFRGAHFDSQIRLAKEAPHEDYASMVTVLNSLDFHGLSQSMLSKMTESGHTAAESMLNTARKLEQWDVPVPTSHSGGFSTVFKALQGINNAVEFDSASFAIKSGVGDTMEILLAGGDAASAAHKKLAVLAILTEADEVFSSGSTTELYDIWAKFEARSEWMLVESFDRISGIISCRESMFSSLSKSSRLQGILKISQHDAKLLESQVLLASSRMSRAHAAFQNALTSVTHLTSLTQSCQAAGVDILAAVSLESAQVLWDQGEMSTSIRMLQDLQSSMHPKAQSIHVGRPEVLAILGHHISEARLEKPDEIINRYLAPAIKELHGVSEGEEAGRVYHQFASFCDQQLQNPDTLEDYRRMGKLREQKEAEVHDLDRMIKTAASQGKERANLTTHRNKAKQWLDLDDREYQRLHDSRQAFLRQSLENYLLCLKACDKFDQDALRFSALWLENWSSNVANTAVAKHISKVGSRKFAPLMNQWSSRLLDSTDGFQNLLFALVLRICVDHPWHGMYQIFTGNKSKGKDEVTLSRSAAAGKVINSLKESKSAGPIWLAIHNTNISFHRFASEKLDDVKGKPGARIALRKVSSGHKLEQDVNNQGNFKGKIPPPTMSIDLQADCDYSSIPMIARWQPEFTVASGISMPKIATAIGTDGQKYKQLFKGGNDDLRQDSIMEQVFAQVSNLLRSQRSTRQRNLGIRTYRVLPLTANSGIIEFVPNTIPLHDYLMPAHHRHFPKDLKGNICRKHIADAQSKSAEQRIKTFRSVIDHFHPVLKYFFMERFEDPDEWFEKRLAYTRSTAAISILGYILGLGDRHGHNILLDEKTGEVVHIDLGIAFEQGRVLPVPEVVPFRLTRDVVDGMGITKTEGVFRRCCEFTLEALRNESYSIMTILDVLRYDPLYSWSLSPLRLKKMQDAQTEAPPVKGEDPGDDFGKRGESEPGEADRALTVVAKKLSKSLSVVATVNELIQQATDERNLALLFCGWAAYA